MARRWTNDLTAKDVTPEHMFLNRRQLLAGIGAAGLLPSTSFAQEGLEPNSFEEITSYCNYYEFGTGKDDPSKNAHRLTTTPWNRASS